VGQAECPSKDGIADAEDDDGIRPVADQRVRR
jgi:hypothetical protein